MRSDVRSASPEEREASGSAVVVKVGGLADDSISRTKRVRRRLADAALGAAVALCAISLAHAARPEPVVFTADIPAETMSELAAGPPRDLIAFVDPLPGRRIMSRFGLRKLPWEAHGRLHAGIDIAARWGAPVVAAADGVVIDRGFNASYGRYVLIRHAEGLTSLYAHLGRIDADIDKGVRVQGGEGLGRVGSSGSSTGPHLHLEIRDGQRRPMDPTLFLGRAFARAGDLPLNRARGFDHRMRFASVARDTGRRRVSSPSDSMDDTPPPEAGAGGRMLEVSEEGRLRAQLGL